MGWFVYVCYSVVKSVLLCGWINFRVRGLLATARGLLYSVLGRCSINCTSELSIVFSARFLLEHSYC